MVTLCQLMLPINPFVLSHVFYFEFFLFHYLPIKNSGIHLCDIPLSGYCISGGDSIDVHVCVGCCCDGGKSQEGVVSGNVLAGYQRL